MEEQDGWMTLWPPSGRVEPPPYEMDVDGTIDRCYFCSGWWGSCTCPAADNDEQVEKLAEEAGGFEFEGIFITEPNVSVCSRFFVNPNVYYGAAYRDWVDAGGLEKWKSICRSCGERNCNVCLAKDGSENKE